MITKRLPLRRALHAGLGSLLLLLFVTVVAAPSARAVCPINQDCGPSGDPKVTYSSTLTIDPSANGQVTVTAPGGTQTVCSATQSAPCTVTDSERGPVDVRPVGGWPTYTLHWSGEHAHFTGWTGACTGLGDCTVTNAEESTSVTATTAVTPTSVTVSVPDPTFRDSAIVASATGERGPFTFEWVYCDGGGLFPSCSDHPATQTGWSSRFLIGSLPNGPWTYGLYVTDALGTKTRVQTVAFTLQDLGLQMSDPAPVTIAPRVTFSAADPAVTGFQCRASSAGSATAWTPCTAADGYAPDLPDGAWDLTVQAIGAEGVTQQMTRHTVVDRTAPTITFGAGPAEKATIHTAATQLGFTSTDANPGPSSCTVDGSPRPSCISPIALSGMGNGAHAVTVTSTDAAGNTATATRHFTVALATTLTAGNVTATYGHAAALTARISPAGATGTVVFTAAGRTLCTAKLVAGVARCSAAAGLVAGRYSVTARYSGPYAASTTRFGLTVAKAAPRMTVRAASPTVRHGRSETITASGLPAGRVTVTRGSHALCRAAVVRGTARCTFRVALPAGRYVLTVRYAGNANYLPAQRTIRITVKR